MSYTDDEIIRQLRLGEDSYWEFKQIEFSGNRPRSPSRDDWADEISAFANTAGGVLVCGVTDAGEVQGMSREQIVELDSVLVGISSDAIKPAVRISTYHRELDGKRLLLVDVPHSESQHDSPGGSFVRVGGSKRRMTSDERLRLAQRRGQARFLWFDKQPVPNTGLGTLDEALWRPLLSAEGRADPETALEKSGSRRTRRTRYGASDRRRPPLLLQHTGRMAAQRLHYGHPLPRYGSSLRPTRYPDNYRSPQPANCRSGRLCRAQYARWSLQRPGTHGFATVQRRSPVRGLSPMPWLTAIIRYASAGFACPCSPTVWKSSHPAHSPTVSPLKSWNIARQPVTRSSPRSSAGCQPVESRGRAGDSSSWNGAVTASPSFAEKPGNSPGVCRGST